MCVHGPNPTSGEDNCVAGEITFWIAKSGLCVEKKRKKCKMDNANLGTHRITTSDMPEKPSNMYTQYTKPKEKRGKGGRTEIFLKTKARMKSIIHVINPPFLWGTCQVLRRKRTGMRRADHTNLRDKTTHEGDVREG